MSYNWNTIKFLESTTNLKIALKRATGRSPSTQIAREIAACLQQGRLFFEIASASPLQIQPLQIYYGMVSFAKAVILVRSGQSIATIAQSHGVSDISEQTTKIENLCLRFRKRGVFQQFNDAVATLGKVIYFDNSMKKFVRKPFDMSVGLDDSCCSLKEILARIPGLQTLYKKTFGEEAACLSVSFYHQDDSVQLRIDDPHLFEDRDDLQRRVLMWRCRYPWLNRWSLSSASHAWDNSVITFRNERISELGEFDALDHTNGEFHAPFLNRRNGSFAELVPALAGGLTAGHPTTIQPLNEVSLHEFSLQFCGAFLLSSLVRYRPQIWQHALSHTSLEQSTADDHALSLVEAFSAQCLTQFPHMVESVIDG